MFRRRASKAISLANDNITTPFSSCSFCGKGRHEVHKLFAQESKGICICDECIVLCITILGQEGYVTPDGSCLFVNLEAEWAQSLIKGLTATAFVSEVFGGEIPAGVTVPGLLSALQSALAARLGIKPVGT